MCTLIQKKMTMLVVVGLVVAIGRIAGAAHVPVGIDVPGLRPAGIPDGYLDFMTPVGFIPIAPAGVGGPIPSGGIFAEEHTGWTDLPLAPGGFGLDFRDLVPPLGTDNDPWAGDHADFDWVQENRPDETGVTPGGSNHPGPGAMGWTIGPTVHSPHTSTGTLPATPGGPHGHSVEEVPAGPLPHLDNDDFTLTHFNAVDVFSVISPGEDFDVDALGALSARDAALDYDLWFVDLTTATSTPGIPVIAWVPGWTGATGTDDWVARWVPSLAGFWNAVAIDPPFGFGHDQITEIDAIKAIIPEPSTVILAAMGLIGLAAFGWRRRKR